MQVCLRQGLHSSHSDSIVSLHTSCFSASCFSFSKASFTASCMAQPPRSAPCNPAPPALPTSLTSFFLLVSSSVCSIAWCSLLVLSISVFICFTPLMAFSTSVSMYLLPAAESSAGRVDGGGWMEGRERGWMGGRMGGRERGRMDGWDGGWMEG